jgi:predicted HTH transcriptional regulator
VDVKKAKNLIKKEEGPKLDFKRTIDVQYESGRKELAKDICAIANSRGGRGYLIIGVEDKTKRIVGIEDTDLQEEQIQQIVSMRCDPPIPISLEFINIGDKKIAVITIYVGSQKPYQLRENGAFYVRRGSTTDTMRKQELISALQENMELNIETCPIINSDINLIDEKLVKRYFNFQGIEIDESNKLPLLTSSSIIYKESEAQDYCLTLGGALVFCKNNNILLPHNMIKLINKLDNDFDEIYIIKGDLLDMLDGFERVLSMLLPKKYPINAVCEVIKDVILYRDYTIYYREIEVSLNYNNISIISPGIMVQEKELREINFTRRNMWIYEKLVVLDEKGRFAKSGKGFSKVKRAFKGHGKVIFINSLENNIFKVIFPGVYRFVD